MKKLGKVLIILALISVGLVIQLAFTEALPDGVQTFNDATVKDDGSIDSGDRYFNLSASRAGLNADQYGAFISSSENITETVYFDMVAQNGLDNFQLAHIYMGDYDDSNNGSYYDVTVTGYLDGVQVFQTTPYTKLNEANEVDLNIDYSVAANQPIDKFRITYTIQADTDTNHNNFNILNFTIGESSAVPPTLYTVTFKDYEGSVLKTESVYGGNDATAPANPTRTGYDFAGWDTAFTNVASDLTVTATYTISTYTVTFKDHDGTTLKTDTVNHGTSATPPDSDPTRTGYAFTGWDVAYDNITSDLTVTAQYSINSYTVTFKDHDGTTLKTESVNYGAAATAPTPSPTRTGYTFTSWDVAYDNITAALTVTAQYSINSYTVTFKDHDGTTLKAETVNYGSAATAPTDPTRENYIFSGWDTVFTNITANLTVSATYTSNTHTVTFKDYEGTTLKTETVNNGAAATAPTDPTRLGYTFTGWDVAYNNVTTDLTVTAQYTINTYNVVFKDYEGTELKTETVNYGAAATAPADPGRTGYTFTGWDVAYNNITSALTVTAQYSINSYNVIFKDYEGTELKTESVNYGAAATAPADPTRTGYTFTGWDVAYNNITSALTVTAEYTINSYTVTFKDHDGTMLKNESVNYGSAATAPADPSRTGYTFTGWDVAYNNITSALTVTAEYTINSYNVVFKDHDGTELKTESVNYGSAATAPSDPTRTGYTFIGWDVAYNNITSALTVTAQYSINSYNVVFKDYEGTELKTESVNYGSAATAPADPSRTGYTFTGWDVAYNNITSALTVTAQYTINSYNVVFKDYEGTELKTESVNYGSAATAPSDPTRTGYTFTGWDVAYNNITSALTVTAQYSINSYNVVFNDHDGTALKTESVNYGSAATAPVDPTRTGYTFTGWDVAYNNITSALTVTAQYTINSYNVVFKDYEGTVLKTESVNYGSAATAPSEPTRTGYTFTGWDVAYNNITSALTVTAQYSINSYNVVFKDHDGTELKIESVNYGSAATAPTDPSRTGYTFTGWDVAYNNITSAVTVTAQYNINSYNVVFNDHDGTALKTETVNYGSAATAPVDPSRTGYTFTGWDVAYTNITSALTVIAQYTINSYNVVFKDYEGTELKTESVNYSSAATAPSDLTRTGYTFTGWDVAYDNITSALTVTAQYNINSYNVVFKDHDGTELKTESVNYGSAATAPADPTWTGHTFTG
ncbi:InlB B-repeat-containing protein, partial [Fusibacter paucivorans]